MENGLFLCAKQRENNFLNFHRWHCGFNTIYFDVHYRCEAKNLFRNMAVTRVRMSLLCIESMTHTQTWLYRLTKTSETLIFSCQFCTSRIAVDIDRNHNWISLMSKSIEWVRSLQNLYSKFIISWSDERNFNFPFTLNVN